MRTAVSVVRKMDQASSRVALSKLRTKLFRDIGYLKGQLSVLTHYTNNIVIETAGTMGMGLIAGRGILPDKIIAVFGNAIILQEMRLVQMFTNIINSNNLNHPTRGFQCSIFYPLTVTACVGAKAQFSLVLSFKTNTGRIGVDVTWLIMKIGDRSCNPLRSNISSDLALCAFLGFLVPS